MCHAQDKLWPRSIAVTCHAPKRAADPVMHRCDCHECRAHSADDPGDMSFTVPLTASVLELHGQAMYALLPCTRSWPRPCQRASGGWLAHMQPHVPDAVAAFDPESLSWAAGSQRRSAASSSATLLPGSSAACEIAELLTLPLGTQVSAHLHITAGLSGADCAACMSSLERAHCLCANHSALLLRQQLFWG